MAKLSMFKLSIIKLSCAASLLLSVTSLANVNETLNINISGEIKQGALVVGKTAASNTVTLNGKTLTLSNTGDYAFGFSRDDDSSYQLVIVNENGDRVTKTLTPSKRDYKLQRIEGIKKSIMQPSDAAIKRSRQDSSQIKIARIGRFLH